MKVSRLPQPIDGIVSFHFAGAGMISIIFYLLLMLFSLELPCEIVSSSAFYKTLKEEMWIIVDYC